MVQVIVSSGFQVFSDRSPNGLHISKCSIISVSGVALFCAHYLPVPECFTLDDSEVKQIAFIWYINLI